MSGSSHGYLYRQEPERLASGELDDVLAGMANRLRVLGWDALAWRTDEVATTAREAREHLAELAEPLRDVWHAVEWFDSADYGFDQVRQAVDRYAQGQRS